MSKLTPKKRRFAEFFAEEFKRAYMMGDTRIRVGTRAALMAGYGDSSWHTIRQTQAAEQAAIRNLKDPAVLELLRTLGLEKYDDGFRPIAIQPL